MALHYPGELLQNVTLPEDLVRAIVDVLALVHTGENDFISVVLELISDMREILVSESSAQDYVTWMKKKDDLADLERQMGELELARARATSEGDLASSLAASKVR